MGSRTMSTILVGFGIVALLATLGFGGYMLLETMKVNAVETATEDAEDFVAQMEEFWPAAVREIQDAAADDLGTLIPVVEDILARAPELADASDHASENSFAYRRAAEFRDESLGGLEQLLDGALLQARDVTRFIDGSQEMLEWHPVELWNEASSQTAQTLRTQVADLYQDRLDEIRALDLPESAEELRDRVLDAGQAMLDQVEANLQRLENRQGAQSYQISDEHQAAFVATFDYYSHGYLPELGAELAPVLGAQIPDLI